MRKNDKEAYFPHKVPVWLELRSLQIVSNMETFEEEDKEPQLVTSIQGVAQFSRNLGIGVIGDTGTYSREVRFSISGKNYSDIVERRKQIIENHGVDDDIHLYCNDKLGTGADITYMYAEYSEVGKLWGESWSVGLVVPNNLLQQLVSAIQFDRVDCMEVSLNLLGVYTDKDPADLSHSRDQSMLFLKPQSENRSVKEAYGYVNTLGIGSRRRACDELDSDANFDEAQITTNLIKKLHTIQTLLKTIVVILLLYALLWVIV